MTAGSSAPWSDVRRRSVWLALAVGLATLLRSPGAAFIPYGGQSFQVAMFVATLVAFGLSLCLCLLVVVPEARVRLGPRFSDEGALFSLAFALFVIGLLLTIVAFAVSAIDSLDEETPFG